MRMIKILVTTAVFSLATNAAANDLATNNPYYACLKAQISAWCYVQRDARPPLSRVKEICREEREIVRSDLIAAYLKRGKVSSTQAIDLTDNFLDDSLVGSIEAYQEACLSK